MAHGKPVLAHKSGGHLEVVKEGLSGMFIEDISIEGIANKIREFDDAVNKKQFNAEKIRATVQKFGKERFQKELSEFINEKLSERK